MMEKLKTYIKNRITPSGLTLKDGIAFWQERVLLILLFISIIAGFITYIPSLLLAIREKLWLIVVLDTLIYACLLFLFCRPSLSFAFRARTIAFITYILGLVLITTLGPFGAGPVWLFFFPVITSVLLGTRQALAALGINVLTIIGLGFLIHFNFTDFLIELNFKAWYIAQQNPIEKWIVISLNFLMLNIVATVCVALILEGLQKSLERLKLSGKKYRQIFENILDVYFETTLEGELIVVSPSVERVSDYTCDELKGKSIFDLYETARDRHYAIEILTRKGVLNNHEIRLKDKHSNIHYCSVNAQLLADANGKPEKIIGILRDISSHKAIRKEKKELEERLNRSKKMEALGLLAGGVAHDLNNILSGIVTYPEVLCMDLAPDDPMRKSLEVIGSSGARASEIVQDLLTLSRRGVVARELLDLNELVAHFMKTPEYKTLASFHPQIDISARFDAGMPYLDGSMVHLEKALMNLIINAMEAQPDGGRVRIKTENRYLDTPLKGYDQVATGHYIVLTVADDGIGIPPEDLKRIFEPFFTKKVMGRSGTGLGMAVVWGTVQDHEGYIDIHSDSNGSTFELYFPVSRNEMPPMKEDFSFEQIMGSGERILIVDDVPDQRRIAALCLEKLGYTVVGVASGEKAVEYLQTDDADLILLDMIMEPGIDGFETYRRIVSFKPGQKAVIASGYSKTQQVEKAIELGAGAYIKKPYTLENLGLTIKKVLSDDTADFN